MKYIVVQDLILLSTVQGATCKTELLPKNWEKWNTFRSIHVFDDL